ncbi:unnamed protein product, partial [Chrysoparadoxa australica]
MLDECDPLGEGLDKQRPDERPSGLMQSQQSNGFGQSKLEVKQLTKFERDALAQARKKQAEQLERGEIQVAGGRIFKGKAAFASKPASIMFKDFSVNRVHKRRLVVTNVSLSFNSFKVLNLPDTVRDFFEISYIKPGRMSAGMTCCIDITFSPKVNEDIFTELPLRTETGP